MATSVIESRPYGVLTPPAKIEYARAERLALRLRELGIDPDANEATS